MKSKVDKNFSYTLDGYMEAKEYLQRRGKDASFGRGHLTGIELVEEANKLLREERSSTTVLYSMKHYSIFIVKFLRRKIARRISALGCLLSFSAMVNH